MQKQKRFSSENRNGEFKEGTTSKYARKHGRQMYGRGCCANKVSDEALRANRKRVAESGHLGYRCPKTGRWVHEPLGKAAYEAASKYRKPNPLEMSYPKAKILNPNQDIPSQYRYYRQAA